MIFDKSLHKLIDTFLSSAPRPSDLVALSKPVEEAQSALHQKLFMVFLRMATHKESSKDFFTPSVFGDIIYENYLFDIPKLIDLCALYGDEACFSAEVSDDKSHTSQLLQRMIRNVFDRQANYFDDLSASVDTVLIAADNIIEGLRSAKGGKLLDLVLYCYDLTQSLALFCANHRPACQLFSTAGLRDRVLTLAPLLKSSLSQLQQNSEVSRHQVLVLSRRLPLTCAWLLNELLFNSELASPNRKALLAAINSLSSNWPEMLARLDECACGLQHQLNDLNLLDMSDMRSVMDKIQGACRSYPQQIAAATGSEASSSASASVQSVGESSASTQSSSSQASADPYAIARQQVLDLLPDYDAELVDVAVQQTDGNVERAVNFLLEGRVTKPEVESAPPSRQTAQKSVPSSRPSGKATRGMMYTNYVLEGNGHDEAVAAIRATLDALETQEFEDTIAGRNEYDDEYDDTYDSHVLGDLPGAGGEDRDEFVIRRLNQKAPLFRRQSSGTESGSEGEGGEGSNDKDGSGKHHHGQGANGHAGGASSHHHPGQQYKERGNRHGGGPEQGNTGRGGAGPRGGGARGGGRGRGGRGRGVTPEERRTYKNNEQHKSSRANHNRKSGAAWKQRGMGGINAAPPK